MAKTKMPTVSTSAMISNVASLFDQLPKKITKEVISKFLNLVESEVTSGKKLRLDKIGILQVKERAPRIGRNPQTGEEIQIPASKKVAFRTAKSLKEQVAGLSAKAKKMTNAKTVAKKKK